MPTKSAIDNSIFDWLNSVVGPVPVDWEDFDDPDRRGDRVSIRFLDDAAAHHPIAEIVNGVEVISETTMLTLVINARGDNADSIASNIRSSIWASKRSGYDDLWAYVGLGSVSSITNLSALESAQIGNRFELRVKLHANLEHNYNADIAETVQVTVSEERKGIVLDSEFGPDPYPIPEDC